MSARALRAVPEQPDDRSDFGMPRDDDAERAVLGAVMLGGPEILDEIRELVEPCDFYLPAHETIFHTLCILADSGRPRDAVALAHALGNEAGKLGGPAYFHTLMESVPTAANGPYYAELVKDKAYARHVVAVGTRLTQMARCEMEPDLVTAIEREITSLTDRRARGWAEPVLLTNKRPVPAYPVTSLPTWVRAKVEAVAHDTQTPVDLAGTLALACLATAAGGLVRVDVRPETGWSEPTNLYIVAALPPGSRKSPVFASMTGPILAAESHLQETAAPLITELAVDRKAADEYAGRMADAYAKASTQERDGARHEAHQAALAAAAIEVPKPPRLFTDDATPEQIGTMLADQGGRMAVLSAESEIFDIIAGRYSATPNMNVVLKGHAGDAIRVDRKGRPSESIDSPALTLGVCTQPAALASLAAIPGAAGRGLLARFLFTVPETNIGKRETKPKPADRAAHHVYGTKLGSLILAMLDLPEPIRLGLSPKAAELLDAAAEDAERAMDDGGPLAHLRDWSAKAVGAMMRIAGLLHLAEHLDTGYRDPISFETIAAAHALIEYYTAHTLAAFDLMTTDPASDRAASVLAWIERAGPVRFTPRDAFRGLPRSKFAKMTDLDPALALLEQHGYIRRLAGPPSTVRGGRPPAPEYEANPALTQ